LIHFHANHTAAVVTCKHGRHRARSATELKYFTIVPDETADKRSGAVRIVGVELLIVARRAGTVHEEAIVMESMGIPTNPVAAALLCELKSRASCIQWCC